MSKITHRQARESLNDLVGEWKYDGTLGQYINQQEKQEKLLVFYKDLAEVRKEIHDLIVVLKKPKDERLNILFTQEYVISNHIRRLENE